MSGAKSIASLHAEVTANAARFVDEFNRADREAKKSGLSIRQEVTNMIEHTERSFSGARFAHGLLSSFGIGSGAAIVETVFEAVNESFRASAEDAKKFSEYVSETLKNARELAEVRLTNFVSERSPAEGEDRVEKRISALKSNLAEADARQRASQIEISRASGAGTFERAIAAAGNTMGSILADSAGHLPLGEEWDRKIAGLKKSIRTPGQRGDDAAADLENAIKDSKRLSEAVEKWDHVLKQLHDKRTEGLEKWQDKTEEMIDKAKREGEAALTAARNKASEDAVREVEQVNHYRDQIGEIVEREKERFLNVRPDHMTRLGLATGGSYNDLGRDQLATLKRIETLMQQAWRRAGNKMNEAEYAY